MEKSLLEETTGYIGIGAVEMLAILAVFDAGTGFYDLVRAYMVTSALFAIPCLAIAYLLGLGTVVFWSQATDRRSSLSPELLSKLSALKAEHLVSRFCEAERQSRLLGGSTVSMAMLALGVLAEVVRAGPFVSVAVVAACLLMAIAVACGVLSRRLQRRAADFIQRALPKADA